LEEDRAALAVGTMFAKLTAYDNASGEAKNFIIAKIFFMKFGCCFVGVAFIVEDRQQVIVHFLVLLHVDDS
jgi:hypothetical protein